MMHVREMVMMKLDCEQSLFFFRFSESNTRARERRSRESRETRAAAREEKRASCLSRLAPSVTRVAICVSRVLLDGLQKKERLLVVYDVVISIGGIFFFYRTLCMLHDTRRKAEHSVTLWQPFPPFCTRLLFVVNTLTVFLSFCYSECELFAVFIKILVDNFRRLRRPSVIFVPVKCPRGGGI